MRISVLRILTVSAILASGAGYCLEATEGGPVFKMHRVGSYRGEACGVGDFNNDGKLDIVALPYIYLAPEFTAVEICRVEGDVDEEGKGYRWDFMNAPTDVDGDGLLDVITASWFGKKAEWLKIQGRPAACGSASLLRKTAIMNAAIWLILTAMAS